MRLHHPQVAAKSTAHLISFGQAHWGPNQGCLQVVIACPPSDLSVVCAIDRTTLMQGSDSARSLHESSIAAAFARDNIHCIQPSSWPSKSTRLHSVRLQPIDDAIWRPRGISYLLSAGDV